MAADFNHHLWSETCQWMADAISANPLDAPLWIVPDTRHKSAAEETILIQTKGAVLPTEKILSILQFAGKLLNLTPVEVTLSPAEAILLLNGLLSADIPKEYDASFRTPGFTESLWFALEDIEARGYLPKMTLPNAASPEPTKALQFVQKTLKKKLDKSGRYTAGQILNEARLRLLQEAEILNKFGEIILGPFFELTPLEEAFVRALHQQSKITLSTQDHNGNLIKLATDSVSISQLTPVTPQDELREIFSFIAEKVCQKERSYGDFRIINPDWRNRLNEIESISEQFHIPIKFVVGHDLGAFPGASLLLRILSLFKSNWQRQEMLNLLRSRLINADRAQIAAAIEMMLLQDSPSGMAPQEYWIDNFAKRGFHDLAHQLEAWVDLDQHCSETCNPVEFTEWLRLLSDTIQERFNIDRQKSEGWKALEKVIEQFRLTGEVRKSRNYFITQFESAIRVTNFQSKQLLSDAVEICSATREDFVAKPVLFYCGLTSRVPSKGRISSFDQEVRGSNYQSQYRLFISQLSNATNEIYLSSPRYDDNGSEQAKSPFLQSLKQDLPDKITGMAITPWLPHHVSLKKQVPHIGGSLLFQISSDAGRRFSGHCNQYWSVSQLNNAIQCPYLHFASDILDLTPQIDQVTEGATQSLIGTLVHKALECWLKSSKSGKVFNLEEWINQDANLKIAWTETHLEFDRSLEDMIATLQAFLAKDPAKIAEGFKPVEAEFEFKDPSKGSGLVIEMMDSSVRWKGKIDRIDESQMNRSIIIDYKYQNEPPLNEFYNDFEAGFIPQLPIYGDLLQRQKEGVCDAWLQIYLRSGKIYGYYFTDDFNLKKNFSDDSRLRQVSAETKADLVATAFNQAEIQRELVSRGMITPKPRKKDRCGPGKCNFADLCRYRQSWIKKLK